MEDYEGMEVDDEGGPGPQRCKYMYMIVICICNKRYPIQLELYILHGT